MASRGLAIALAFGLPLFAAGCSAGGGTEGTGGTGTGETGNAPGLNVGAGNGSGLGPGEACQSFSVDFSPKPPTVYILVDRSGSMNDEGFWVPLRQNLLPVVQELQADVRFGLGTYTGTSSSCTGLEEQTPIDFNNYDAIASTYGALSPLDGGETPTAAAVQQATDLLSKDPSPGDRFILLVTDGNPDFCNNGQDTCAQDALIGAIQESHAAGVETLVFGLRASAFPIEEGTLDRYANAGRGEPVAWTKGIIANGRDKTGIEDECSGGEWATFNTDGVGPVGAYSEVSGAATAFSSDDPAAVVGEVRTAVEGLKSCTFDMSSGEKTVSVVPGSESQGTVVVDGVNVPLDQWQMQSASVLELTGDACLTWQRPEVTSFDAGFPCEALVVK